MTDQFVYFVGWLHITAYGLLAVAVFGLGFIYASVWVLERILRYKAIHSEFIAFIQARIKADPKTYERFRR